MRRQDPPSERILREQTALEAGKQPGAEWMCAWGLLLASGQEGVIRLLEVLEFLDQDGGNQITQLTLPESPEKLEGPSLREGIPAARAHVPPPRTPAPIRLFPDDWDPLHPTPQPGRTAAQQFPVLLSSPSLRGPKGKASCGSARGSSVSLRGKGGGGEREEAGGGRRSFSAARSSRGDRGGGAPFPPHADCCGVLPVPARVCEGERVRWVGPMGVIEGFGDAERRFPLPSEWGREVGGSRARPLSLRDSLSSLQEEKVPGGSGWRSCAAAQQLPELAAAGRGAGKLRSALLQLVAGGSPLDTSPPRYAPARPRGTAAGAGTPLPAPLAQHPFRPRALQAARCLSALRGGPRLFPGRGSLRPPGPPGLWGRRWSVSVYTLRCVGSGRPGVGSAGGAALCWRRHLLRACPHSSFPRFLLTSAGRAGHFPLRSWQRRWERFVVGLHAVAVAEAAAPGLEHQRELRSLRAAPSGCCAGGAERCSSEPCRESSFPR